MLGETSGEPLKTHFRNLATSSDAKLVAAADKAISENTLLHAIMRNTIAPVMLNAGFRGNVIPGSAEATINVRVVPGTTVAEIVAEVQRAIGDPGIEVAEASSGQLLSVGSAPPPPRNIPESPKSGALYEALVKNAKLTYPSAKVTPYLFQAGTDASPWRTRAFRFTESIRIRSAQRTWSGCMGTMSACPIESLESGLRMITQTLLDVAAK
jgi:acetylornithine deacetylase/succinyl-diaminopimelate desuccinylase-like protein